MVSAEDMRRAVLSRLDQVTIVIKAAAVADYRPRKLAEQKMKRTGPITIEFEPTEDILREVVVSRRPGTLVIGFAAETENLLEHGRDKLLRKGADAIVLNDVSRPGLGFDSDRNAATFLTPRTAIELPEMTKHELAESHPRRSDRPTPPGLGGRRDRPGLQQLQAAGLSSSLANAGCPTSRSFFARCGYRRLNATTLRSKNFAESRCHPAERADLRHLASCAEGSRSSACSSVSDVTYRTTMSFDSQSQQAIAAHMQYLRDLGIFDFYRRDTACDRAHPTGAPHSPT